MPPSRREWASGWMRRGDSRSIQDLCVRDDAPHRRVSRRGTACGRVIRRAPRPGFRAQRAPVPVWKRIGVKGGLKREDERRPRATDPRVSDARFGPCRSHVPRGVFPARGRETIAVRRVARPAAPPVITHDLCPGEISPSTCHVSNSNSHALTSLTFPSPSPPRRTQCLRPQGAR